MTDSYSLTTMSVPRIIRHLDTLYTNTKKINLMSEPSR